MNTDTNPGSESCNAAVVYLHSEELATNSRINMEPDRSSPGVRGMAQALRQAREASVCVCVCGRSKCSLYIQLSQNTNSTAIPISQTSPLSPAYTHIHTVSLSLSRSFARACEDCILIGWKFAARAGRSYPQCRFFPFSSHPCSSGSLFTSDTHRITPGHQCVLGLVC